MREPWTLPSGIDPTAWAEFEQHRKEIRKPLKDLARTKNANILLKMTIAQQVEAIDTTIAHGWAGIFPPRPTSKPFNASTVQSNNISKAFMKAFGRPPPAGKSVDECRELYQLKMKGAQGIGPYAKKRTTQWWNE